MKSRSASTMHIDTSNIHWLDRRPVDRQEHPSLDDVRTLIATVTRSPLKTSDHLRRALVALDLANLLTHDLIGRVEHDQTRSALLARHAFLAQLTDLVRKKLASLAPAAPDECDDGGTARSHGSVC